MHEAIFAKHCAWANTWTWKKAHRSSGADISSNTCMAQARGDASCAYRQAEEASRLLQEVPGVERAWAQHPGTVCVVLSGSALLQLSLQNNAQPWQSPEPVLWLLDYGIVAPFEVVGLTQAREGILGDTLARAAALAGHRVVRQRLVLNTGRHVVFLTKALQLHMQALEQNIPVDYTCLPGAVSIAKIRMPRALPRGALMQTLAEQAHRMGVRSIDEDGIEAFAVSTIMALQEEGFSQLRVEFDTTLLSSELEPSIERVLDEWSHAGHTHREEESVMFHGPSFGAPNEIVAVTRRATPTYFVQRVAHHMEQLRRAPARVVTVRDAGHAGLARNTHIGLQALNLDSTALMYFLVHDVQDSSTQLMRTKRSVGLNDAIKMLGVNGLRLALLKSSSNRTLRVEAKPWMACTKHEDKSMYDAYVKAHAVVQEHFGGVAAMQAGPIAHAAKPLLMALLRWPQRLQAALDHNNPSMIHRHALELVGLVHKTYAQVPMQELEGAGMEAMGTAWSLAADQLRTVFDTMGLDAMEWETRYSVKS